MAALGHLNISRCVSCGLQIKKGKYVREQLTQAFYHGNCFKCQTCKNNLWGHAYCMGEMPFVHCTMCRSGPNLVEDPDQFNFCELDDSGNHIAGGPPQTEVVELTLPMPTKKAAGRPPGGFAPLTSHIVEEEITLTLPPPPRKKY